MASIKFSSDRRIPRNPTSGFTLVEVMMVTLISAFVFAGVLSAYIFLGRGLARQVNEESLESRARLALYWLSQDVASATGIATQNPGTAATGYQFLLYEPTIGAVTYYCDWSGGSANGMLVRNAGGTSLTLLKNLSAINFVFYDVNGNSITAPSTGAPLSAPTTLQANVKQVCMYFTSTAGTAFVGNQSNFTVSSPRLIMKNKGFLTDPNDP
jgi:type II secretory pathway pseudopilin PulG